MWDLYISQPYRPPRPFTGIASAFFFLPLNTCLSLRACRLGNHLPMFVILRLKCVTTFTSHSNPLRSTYSPFYGRQLKQMPLTRQMRQDISRTVNWGYEAGQIGCISSVMCKTYGLMRKCWSVAPDPLVHRGICHWTSTVPYWRISSGDRWRMADEICGPQ
jgi:hypothetical protein